MTAVDLTGSTTAIYTQKNSLQPLAQRIQPVDIAKDAATHVIGDTIDCITVGPNEFVIAVWANVITASTNASATINVGDSGSATRFLSALSTASTGRTFATYTAVPYNYATANKLRITQGASAGASTPTNGLVEIGAIVASLPKTV